MKLPFRRRTILDIGSSGMVTEWKIPYDPKATDDEDALVRHFEWLSRFEPETLVMLMSTRLGSLLFGRVRILGPKPTIDMLENFDDIVEATPGPLSDEEYEREMLGDSPLLARVYRRLKSESNR